MHRIGRKDPAQLFSNSWAKVGPIVGPALFRASRVAKVGQQSWATGLFFQIVGPALIVTLAILTGFWPNVPTIYIYSNSLINKYLNNSTVTTQKKVGKVAQ